MISDEIAQLLIGMHVTSFHLNSIGRYNLRPRILNLSIGLPTKGDGNYIPKILYIFVDVSNGPNRHSSYPIVAVFVHLSMFRDADCHLVSQ